jgi:CheY-like chemotaxis protein
MYVQRFEIEGGFDIQVARNGLEGLALFQSFRPDVTLLDMMMPIMSGLETLQKLRALPDGGNIKIIALTNMNDPEMINAIEKLGVAQHIVKANSTPGAIVDAVRRLTSPKP